MSGIIAMVSSTLSVEFTKVISIWLVTVRVSVVPGYQAAPLPLLPARFLEF